MKNIHFKVKRMTLAAEARIIKQQEKAILRRARERSGVWSREDTQTLRKHMADADKREQDDTIHFMRTMANACIDPLPADRLYATYHSLHHHRVMVVRPAARAMHLAHAYLKGMPYARVEAPSKRKSAVSISLMQAMLYNLRTFGSPAHAFMKIGDVEAWITGAMPVGAPAKAAEAEGPAPSVEGAA
jgi:hypothetical protein